ncbi:hypothetical protein BH11PLA1_BH11PLA1_04350 [soil metagenome]
MTMLGSAIQTSPENTGLNPAVAAEALSAPESDPAFTALCAQVEALILTSPRAVNPQRLAVALGLIPAETEDVPPLPSGNDAPDEPALVRAAPRKRRPRAKVDVEGALARITRAIAALNDHYTSTARSFRIEPAAGGYRMMTLPAFRAPIAILQNLGAASRLSKPAVETLAIIAYRQPVTRAHLEAIRGVACGEVLKSLLDKRLVTIAGRAEELGRPLLYATSRAFLDAFGLVSLKDLPAPSELGFASPFASKSDE